MQWCPAKIVDILEPGRLKKASKKKGLGFKFEEVVWRSVREYMKREETSYDPESDDDPGWA